MLPVRVTKGVLESGTGPLTSWVDSLSLCLAQQPPRGVALLLLFPHRHGCRADATRQRQAMVQFAVPLAVQWPGRVLACACSRHHMGCATMVCELKLCPATQCTAD